MATQKSLSSKRERSEIPLLDEMTSYDRAMLRLRFSNLKTDVSRSSDILLASQNEENKKIKALKSEVIPAQQFLDFKGFKVKESYDGVSPYTVVLIPQAHSTKGEVSENAKKSQENIVELLKSLNGINLWEGASMQSSYNTGYRPDLKLSRNQRGYFKKAFKNIDAFSALQGEDDKRSLNYNIESRTLLPESDQGDVEIQKQYFLFLQIKGLAGDMSVESFFQNLENLKEINMIDVFNFNIIKNTADSLLEGMRTSSVTVGDLRKKILSKNNSLRNNSLDLKQRNMGIVSNTIALHHNFKEKGFEPKSSRIILGASHFIEKSMGGRENTIQGMLESQGISYVLLDQKQSPFLDEKVTQQ